MGCARGCGRCLRTVVLALAGVGEIGPSQDRADWWKMQVQATCELFRSVRWFSGLTKHPALALKVENLCIDVRKNPLAVVARNHRGSSVQCRVPSRGISSCGNEALKKTTITNHFKVGRNERREKGVHHKRESPRRTASLDSAGRLVKLCGRLSPLACVMIPSLAWADTAPSAILNQYSHAAHTAGSAL